MNSARLRPTDLGSPAWQPPLSIASEGWWRRRESNPRPKLPQPKLLRAFPVYWFSPPHAPAGRIMRQPASIVSHGESRQFPMPARVFDAQPEPHRQKLRWTWLFLSSQEILLVGSYVFPAVLRGRGTSARNSDLIQPRRSRSPPEIHETHDHLTELFSGPIYKHHPRFARSTTPPPRFQIPGIQHFASLPIPPPRFFGHSALSE